MDPPRGRRQLTESEEEDLEAEAEFEAEGEEAEEEGVTYDEYLASRRPVALPKLPEQRKANEGVAMKVVQRDARTNLERVAASEFKEEVSFTPALTAAGMSWTLVEDEDGPEPRTFHAACVVQMRDKAPFLMIHGGRSESRVLGDAWWFDVQKQEWSKKNFVGAVPGAHSAHALGVLPDHLSTGLRIFLIGGNTNSGRDDNIHVLTPRETGEWQWGAYHRACSPRNVFTQRLPSTRAWQEAVDWCGCKDYNTWSTTPELYRPHWSPFIVQGAWKGVSSHTAVTMPSEVWVYGGRADKALSKDTFYIGAPATVTLKSQNMSVNLETGPTVFQALAHDVPVVKVGQIIYRTAAPTARFGHAAAFVQTKGMYIIGGTDGQQEFDHIWLLPYGTGAWSRISYTGRLPTLVNPAVALVDTLIYIFGGFSRGQALNNLFVFDTKANSITQIDVPGVPPSPRGGHSMAYLDGSLYIFGGGDEKGHVYGDLFRLNNVNDFIARTSFLGSELCALLEKEAMTDCQLTSSEGGSVKCHRAILAARCPYFRDQLTAAPGTAEWIFSFSVATLQRFVRFLYRDIVRLSAAQAPEMRRLAVMTSMKQLEAICDSIQRTVSIPPSSLAADMQWLLESSFLSDVELVAGGRVFKAHRAVLSARSPFFRAMFASKFKESQTGARVVMNDMEPEMLHALLEFLYREFVDPTAHQLAFELLGQCDLLELPDLRDRCTDILKVAVSTENVSLLHNAAEMFKAPALAAAALKYAIDTALASGGLDEELNDALSERLLEQVNAHRTRNSLPPLVPLRQRSQEGGARSAVLSWNDTCAKCSLPYAYASGAWTGRLPKELLVEACAGEAPRYEPVLSLKRQIGHRAKVTLPSGVSVSPSLPRNTRRDAEQLAALAALHTLRCGLDVAKIV